jgi:hypothetical protein
VPSSLFLAEPASLVPAPVFHFWRSVSCPARRACPLVSFEILVRKPLVTFLSCAAGISSLKALLSRELRQGCCLFCCELLQGIFGKSIESSDQKDSWFKLLFRGDFADASTRCSVKCL